MDYSNLTYYQQWQLATYGNILNDESVAVEEIENREHEDRAAYEYYRQNEERLLNDPWETYK